MNSDVKHSYVPDGPEGHRPKAHHKMMGAEELYSEKALKRTILEPQILERLVTEVHEKVATDLDLSKKKEKKSSFGVVDLWNIRRNGRYAAHAIKQPRIVNGFGYDTNKG